MKNKTLPVLFALTVLFAANQASAYYSPSTGRWLSRDPIGEPGFELLCAANTVPPIGQVVNPSSLPPSRLFNRDPLKGEPNRYAFIANNPINDFDPNGEAKFSTYTIIFTAGRGLSHALLGCVYCGYCNECTARATAQIENTQQLFGDNLLGFENWLHAARPGTECGDLCANCTKEYLISMRWFYGSVALKYGVKIFGQ